MDRSQLPVLVVEDDQEVRGLLRREIEDHGHPVTTAASAEQALEVLEQSDYAVVVTDIRMPGMDGVELTQRIKQLKPDTEVILVTGFASVDSASKAVRLGASDYITKPFGDIACISESVDRALHKHRQRLATDERISLLEAHGGALAHVLDHLPVGLVILDNVGQVLMTNQAANVILEQGDGLRLNGGQLQAFTGPELRNLIDQATSRQVGGATALDRPSGERSLSVLVTPLPSQSEGGNPSVAVFVSDPTRRVETAEELLCRLYAMTPAEARMAAILMQGKSVEDAAGELAISTNTARTHLKHIFSKTNTVRQGDLISLLLSGPALLQLED